MLKRRELRALVLPALLVAGLSAPDAIVGLHAGLEHLAPAALLLLPLVAGRFVGEERLAALVSRRVQCPRRAVVALAARLPRAPRVHIARGGALLARTLAERGPRRAPRALNPPPR